MLLLNFQIVNLSSFCFMSNQHFWSQHPKLISLQESTSQFSQLSSWGLNTSLKGTSAVVYEWLGLQSTCESLLRSSLVFFGLESIAFISWGYNTIMFNGTGCVVQQVRNEFDCHSTDHQWPSFNSFLLAEIRIQTTYRELSLIGQKLVSHSA